MISHKTVSAALESLLTAIQIANNKLEHLFSLSGLLVIYCTDLQMENEGHFKIKLITSLNLWPLTLPEPYLKSVLSPPKRSLLLQVIMQSEHFEIDSQ